MLRENEDHILKCAIDEDKRRIDTLTLNCILVSFKSMMKETNEFIGILCIILIATKHLSIDRHM